MMIAEESTSFPKVSAPVDVGGLGFGFKWNMGWMNDSLEYIKLDPIYRQYHHNEMTFAMVYAYSENYILPISHDEVVHGKGSMVNKIPQDDWRKFATLRSFYSFMWAFPGKQLLFMGQEFGQRSEWNEAVGLEWWVDSLQWHKGLRDMMREINHVQARTPALYELDSEPEGFRWINDNDWMANTFSWLRFDRQGGMVACVANFSPEPYPEYGLRVPGPGAGAKSSTPTNNVGTAAARRRTAPVSHNPWTARRGPNWSSRSRPWLACGYASNRRPPTHRDGGRVRMIRECRG